jgi:exosortase/archaeosortase family protein
LLGSQRLEVAQACSGLRLFSGILAVTFAFLVVFRRPLWEKLVLICAAVPIAIVSNVARIVATGLLYQATDNVWARGWAHDWAGGGMVLMAAALFWLLLLYLRQLVREEQVMEMTDVVKQCRV